MSQSAHHDSAEFLEVVWLPGGFVTAEQPRHSGWYVRRACDCHHHVVVSVKFETEAAAYRCLWALDADSRQTLARRA